MSPARSMPGFDTMPTVLMGGMKEKPLIAFGACNRTIHQSRSEAHRLNELADAIAGSRVQFRLAHDTALPHVAASHFELRFDQDHHLAVRRQQGANRRQDQGHGYETNIAYGQAAWFRKIFRADITGVRILVDYYAPVLAHLPIKLRGPHIHYIDACGS